MFSNIGKIERLVRILFGIFLVIVGFKFINGYLAYGFLFVGIIAVITGFLGWCGLYSVCNISTKGVGINKISKRDIAIAVKKNKISKTKSVIKAKTPIKKTTTKKKTVSKSTSTKKAVTKKTTTSKNLKKAPVKKKTVAKKKTTSSKKAPAKNKATTKKVVKNKN